MHSLFEPLTAEEIIARLQKIDTATQPLWGKMDAAQILAHCQAPFQVFFGERKMKRAVMGILFGRVAKKKLFADKPWPRGLPTAREFTISDKRDLAQEKQKLEHWIKRFSEEGFTITQTMHPFFGKMSSQEWAVFAYKHLDHHLCQFGV